jgi:hypothetical protein
MAALAVVLVSAKVRPWARRLARGRWAGLMGWGRRVDLF